MKKIFTILLILAIVGLGLAYKKRPLGDEPRTLTSTNTLPPTLPPTDKPGPTGTDKPGPTGTDKPGPTGTDKPGPTGTDKPGPTGTDEPGPTGTDKPGPTGTDKPGPTGTDKPGPTGTNTLPPTDKPGPTGTNTLPPTDNGLTGTNTLPPTDKPGPTGTNTLPPTDKPGPTNTLPPLPTSTSDPAIFKNLTKGCKTAITNFYTDPEITKCLPSKDLLVLLSAITDPDPTKKLTALSQFGGSVCSLPRCNDVAISKAKDSIKQGCLEDDVEKKHDIVAKTALVGTALYTPIIESLCFIVSPNDPGFCFADSLARIVNLPQPFKTPVFDNFTDKVVFGTPTAFCTDCNHRISQEVFNFISDPQHSDVIAILGSIGISQANLTQFQRIIMIKCGFKFLTNNGTFPGLCPQSSQLKSRPRLGKRLKLTGGKKSN
ncbi:3377_t:CDS:2 [Gigaspora margarita]|uniref:3377_t:CDS:1 n=1 Tax=Gigaspora margarita TaxID=4874 RepID=A0ABM8W1X5_GIGMA|nr:3377_t:CDS:2 [Gigaspora margarita]